MNALKHTQFTEEDIKDTSFRGLGLAPTILRTISEFGYETPTPIQEQAIPLILEGNDLLGLAQTGTGKTAAFGLPLIHQLMDNLGKPAPKTTKALILAPTRELVNQIADNLKQYVKKTPLRINLVIGGQSINTQIRNLSRGTDILIATPGRLLDLVDRKALFLDSAKFLVLDEADQMLDLGFIHSLRKIAKMLGKPRQTLLFSATMPRAVEELSTSFLEDPVRVQVSPPGRAADKITQTVYYAQQREKTELLKELLIKHPDDLSLVFARTKHGAEKLMKHLVNCGFKADSIHGNKSQGQRDRALRAFKAGDINILVATDVASRGIDIPGVGQVYNFNLPEVPENYVHRIGRTARAGADGEAIAFCAPDEANLLRAIQKLMGITIEVAGGEAPEWQQKPKGKPHRKGQSASGRGKRGNKTAKAEARPASKAPANDSTQETAAPRQNGKNRYRDHDTARKRHKGSDAGKRFGKKPWELAASDAREAPESNKPKHVKADSASGKGGKKPAHFKKADTGDQGQQHASKPEGATQEQPAPAGPARYKTGKPAGGKKKTRWTSKQKNAAKNKRKPFGNQQDSTGSSGGNFGLKRKKPAA